jgi:heptosyltransferase-3
MRRGNPTNRLLDYYLGIPALNFLASFRLRRALPLSVRRIGVICSPALGDTLLFSGPLQDLRSAFPSAHITHICMRQNLAAAEIIPGADDRLLISLTHPLSTIRTLHAQHFDLVLDFSAWQRLTAAYTLLSGARYTIGFRTTSQHRSRAYDLAIPHSRELHELENFRELLHDSNLVAGRPQPPAIIVPEVVTQPFADDTDLIVFHPWASGARSELREWPTANWVALAQRLAKPETRFIITGAPSDNPRISPLVSELQSSGLRASGFVSPDGFLSLTHLLRRATLVISVNTGVMHLASIAGAPTISLNGPTSETRWGARGRCVANVQPADNSGGYLHLGYEFAGQPADIMQRISVDQVADAATQLLARCGARTRVS